MRAALVLTISLLGFAGAAGATTMLDTRWTRAAERAYLAVDAAKNPKRLPELRVFDERRRLILRSFGLARGTVGATVAAAMRRPVPIAGPDYDRSLAELETRDGRPAGPQARGQARFTIIDYWATWCAPCKALGAELDRAETDPIAVLKASGAIVRRFKKGPDGKLVEVKD